MDLIAAIEAYEEAFADLYMDGLGGSHPKGLTFEQAAKAMRKRHDELWGALALLPDAIQGVSHHGIIYASYIESTGTAAVVRITGVQEASELAIEAN